MSELAPTATVRGLAGRGMPRRLGPILGPIARRFLDDIPFPQDDAARIRELAAAGGVVVYVHRARNPVEHLALARVAQRENLPRARYVGGLSVIALQPFYAAPMLLTRIGSAQREEALLERCVRAGLSAEIFLRRPLHLLSPTSAYRARFIEVLVRAQREMDRPIHLVPLLLALKQRPGRFEPTPLDAIFGTVEEPGLLRALARLLSARGSARFEVSDAVDLRGFVDEHKDAKDDVIAKKVRWSILHHLARVERVVHGPPMKSHTRLKEEVLRDPQLVRVFDSSEKEQGLPRALLEKRARKHVDAIAARPDIDVTRFLSLLLDAIWKRIYDGVFYEPTAADLFRNAARRGPIVLVPSHRSHVDYLVMSWVMLKLGFMPPLVAAGDNLSFFPLGPIFRRGGAYFLRRSFKGDPLYGDVFRAYVRKLFKEGFTQEFFIEGGRSRTGKTLPPKLGLLSMLVDAYLESNEPDAIFLPCHISYERVIEAASYRGELHGKAKEKESARALVKTAGVLKGRYGAVFVTFDEPISLKEHLEARHVARGTITDEERRGAVQTLGHRIVYGINRCGVVTTTALVATAVFGFRRKGVDEPLLIQAADDLVAHLKRKPEGSVRWQPGDIDVRAALARLVDDGLLVRAEAGDRVLYQIAEDAVMPLDIFKNSVLHHFVPECIVAATLGALPDTPQPRVAVASKARALSRVLKLEFIYKVGATFDELFDEAVRNAIAAGLLVEESGALSVPATGQARAARRFAHSLIGGFIEAYHACFAKNSTDVQQALETLKGRALSGELVCAEAQSKAIVENAVTLLKELQEKPEEITELTELLANARLKPM